jgi:hypothetical protein
VQLQLRKVVFSAIVWEDWVVYEEWHGFCDWLCKGKASQKQLGLFCCAVGTAAAGFGAEEPEPGIDSNGVVIPGASEGGLLYTHV